MSIVTYAGIVTKTKAMSGKLLSYEDYSAIAACPSVNDAVQYLNSNSGYVDVLSTLGTSQLHRGDIERVLTYSLFRDFAKLSRFCNSAQKKQLEFYAAEYDQEIVKRTVRRVLQKDVSLIRPIRDDDQLLSYSKLDIKALNQAENIDGLMEALKNTPYEPLFHLFNGKNDLTLFDYEMVLDAWYYSNLWKKKNKLAKGKDLEILTSVFGSQIDLMNLGWISRAKKYYNLSAHDILAYIIPIKHRLSLDLITSMCTCDDPEELERMLTSTYYGKKYEMLSSRELEDLFHIVVEDVYQLGERRRPYSMIPVAHYLYRKEREIDKITTLLECVRYGLSQDEALSYITDRRSKL